MKKLTITVDAEVLLAAKLAPAAFRFRLLLSPRSGRCWTKKNLLSLRGGEDNFKPRTATDRVTPRWRGSISDVHQYRCAH